MSASVAKSSWKAKCDCLRKVHFDNTSFAIFFDVCMTNAIKIKRAVRASTAGKNNWTFIESIVLTSAVIEYFGIDVEDCYRKERNEQNDQL